MIIDIFPYFFPDHGLLVLLETTTMRRFERIFTIRSTFLRRTKKNGGCSDKHYFLYIESFFRLFVTQTCERDATIPNQLSGSPHRDLTSISLTVLLHTIYITDLFKIKYQFVLSYFTLTLFLFSFIHLMVEY